MLVLASSSRYRRSLLERLRVPYVVAVPDVDETPLAGEAPRATALRLAGCKARAVAADHPQALIIGSDQVAVLDGAPLGKPGHRDAARAQLAAMRGRTVVFHTALCLLDSASGASQLEDVPTTVRFRDYSDGEIERYVDAEPAFDCAGSAKIESLGIALVESVESADPTALIGLPLVALVTMLQRAGVRVP